MKQIYNLKTNYLSLLSYYEQTNQFKALCIKSFDNSMIEFAKFFTWKKCQWTLVLGAFFNQKSARNWVMIVYDKLK